MRYQPPDNNNPANPLLKVAALELDKDFFSSGPLKKLKIKASLAFKKSNDMTGKTKTKDGKPVNISFSLLIRRASLHILCKDDVGNSPDGFVTIEKVAYSSPLAVKNKINDAVTRESKSEKHGSVTGKLGIGVSGDGIGLTGKGEAKAGVKAISSHAKKRQSRRSFESVNVSATHAGCEIHWEINPSQIQSFTDDGDHLRGNAFANASGKIIDAFVMRRNDKKPLANIEITGSVFITMKDLHVDDIVFLDDDGYEIKVNNVADYNASMSDLSSLLSFKKLAKERILKQIIRKHLINQGLKVDGANVEICRAFT